MTLAEVQNVLYQEIMKWEGFSVEMNSAGENQVMKIKRGECSFELVLHPMFEYKFITLISLLLEMLVMYQARTEGMKKCSS